jgi:hypothetical protein
MPHGWFVPVKRSDAKQRKGEIDDAAKDHQGELHMFWEGDNPAGYNTLIKDAPKVDIDAFLADSRVRPLPGHHEVDIH